MSPDRKVSAGALAGALSVIIVWLISYFANVEIPPEVASAFTVVLTFGTAYVVTE